MNKTLERLRAHAEHSQRVGEDALQRTERLRSARAAAAAPLIQAFEDVRGELVRVPVLRQVWGAAFDRKDDRLAGLLIDKPGGDAPYGLKFRIPFGSLSFEVEQDDAERLSYICVRSTDGLKPNVMSFADQEHWLEYFYKILAETIELAGA